MNFTGLSDAISTTETNTRKLLRNGTSSPELDSGFRRNDIYPEPVTLPSETIPCEGLENCVH